MVPSPGDGAQLVPGQQPHQRLFDRDAESSWVLRLDQQLERAPRRERRLYQPIEGEDAGRSTVALRQPPGRIVEPIEFGERGRADAATTVAGPVDLRVVNADEVPIAGQPDVAFESVRALGDGQLV